MFSSDIGMSGDLRQNVRMVLWLGLLCLIIVGLLPACEDSTPVAPTVGSTPEPLVTDTPQPTDMVALDPTATNTPLPTFTPTAESLVTNTSEPTDMVALDPTTTNTPLPTFTSIPEPSPTFTPTPEPTATPSPEEIAIANLSQITRWLDYPPDRAHDVVRYALADMWLKDSSFAENVARLHWVIDGVNEVEMRFVSVLRELVRIDVELAEQVLDLPMVADVSPDSELAVHSSLEWLAFGLAENSVEVAKVVLGYSWIIDGVTDRELYALDRLSSLLSNDPEFGKVVASFDWVSDEISDRESSALNRLSDVVSFDPELGDKTARLKWISDRITETESNAISALSSLAQVDVNLAHQTLTYP